jgi:hypothetical protein
VWIGDERWRMLRRLVSRRRGLVKRRKQIKNEISAVLHRNLKGRSPASDPFGKKGRAWIAEQQLPIDERLTVAAGLRQLDFVAGELAQIDELIAQQALDDDPGHRRRLRRHVGRRDRRYPPLPNLPPARRISRTAPDDPAIRQRPGPPRPRLQGRLGGGRHVLVVELEKSSSSEPPSGRADGPGRAGAV